MTGPSHVLTPDGWVVFDAFDPASIEAVKDLLTCGNTRDRVPPTTESGPGAALTARGPDDDLHGGVASA